MPAGEREIWAIYVIGSLYIGYFEMGFQEMAESGYIRLTKPRQVLSTPKGKMIDVIIGTPEEMIINMEQVLAVWRIEEKELITVYWESTSSIKVVPGGSVANIHDRKS